METEVPSRNVYDYKPDGWDPTIRQIVLEIEVQQHQFNQKPCLMVQIRNVSRVIQNHALLKQMSKEKGNFQSM